MSDTDPQAPVVTLYSQPGCGPCIGAEMAMKSAGLEYIKVNIREDPNAAQRIVDLGYQGTPVTTVGDMHWNGCRPDKIKQAKAAMDAWTPSEPVSSE